MRVPRIVKAFIPYQIVAEAFDQTRSGWERFISALVLMAMVMVTVAAIMLSTHSHQDIAVTLQYTATIIFNGLIYGGLAVLGIITLKNGLRSPNKTYRIGSIVLSIALVLLALTVIALWISYLTG